MKKLLITAFVTGFIIAGCSSLESPVSPTTEKINAKVISEINGEFLSLPVLKANGNLLGDLSTSEAIVGSKGGLLEVEGKFGFAGNGSVEVEGSLYIPKKSFDGTKILSMSIDRKSTSVVFGPSGSNFFQPLLLNLKYAGLRLDPVTAGTITFAYLSSDGKVYPVPYASLEVNVKEGTISLVGGQITHFSRFGFVRVFENTP